ncbi:MAG: helical backbone metal receptor [Chloroflexota bacterium]
MNKVTDQMGRTLLVPQRPLRIVSLVPSQTELLFDLGLESEIVGLTEFCIHPAAQVAGKQRVGGPKKFRFDVIARLQPDLIFGNKEENYREGILQLAKSYPVWMSDILTLADACAMIRQVGGLVGKGDRALALAEQIESAFARLEICSSAAARRLFYLENPYLVAAANTFIHEMLTRCGFINVFAGYGNGRYPEVTAEQIRAAQPDIIFLSSEPFPFREKHRQLFAEQFPETAVHLVDGEMFSWYGSRLLLAVDYFQQLQNKLHKGGCQS